MKNIFLIITCLLVFSSCSKDDNDNQTDILSNTLWTQDIGDNSYWFTFYQDGGVGYTETALGDDRFNYLSRSINYKIEEKDNTITIYKNTGEQDPNTGYAKIDTLMTGYLKNNKIHLEGTGVSEDDQQLELSNKVFDLTRYQQK